MTTCCFTGHRQIPPERQLDLTLRLEACLCNLIAGGCFRFRAGGAMGFDRLASETVLRLREQEPSVKLELVLPCHGQDRGWPEDESRAYRALIAQADRVTYLAEQYSPGCMQRRNLQLLAGSDVCVAYQNHFGGGTAFTVAQAKKQGIPVINLGKME